MAIWKAIIASGVRIYFQVVDSTGNLFTGLPSTDFTVVFINPADSASTTLTVTESTQKAGVYYVDVPSAFLTTHGSGQYGLSIEVNHTPPPPPALDAASLFSVEVNQEDIDNLILDDIVDGFLDRADAVESGITWREGLRAVAAVLAGLVTGGPGNPAFRRIGGALASAPRVTVTADADGNRSIIILNL